MRRPERRRAWRIAGCALLAVLMAESLLGTLSIDAHYVADEALAGLCPRRRHPNQARAAPKK